MATTAIEEWIPEIVERLVREFDPVQIILFGSHARGEGRDGSDVDLLVVLPRVDREHDAAVAMLETLGDLPIAKDVIVTTPEELARRGDAIGSVYRAAVREGRMIYGVDERDSNTWLRYASEDLEGAELVSRGPGFAPRIACYQAQQAAEKALKAVLVEDARPVPVTHDLRVLRDLVAEERESAKLEVDLAWLSGWNIRGRYPGDWEEATQADAERAIEAARVIVEAARRDLGGEPPLRGL
jgi:HEPN domain-containing protein/predicted nucleotidyltransferase